MAGIEGATTAYGPEPVVAGGELSIQAGGPTVSIWTWPTPVLDRATWV